MQLQQVVTTQMAYLQETIKSDAEVGKQDISTFFYDLPSTSRRRNKVIIPNAENELRAFSVLDVFDGDAMVLAKQFVYPKDAGKATPLSVWVVGDLDSKDGHALLESALQNVDRKASATRVSYVHVPDAQSANVPGPRLSTLLFQLTAKNEESAVTAESLLDMMDEVKQLKTNLVDLGDLTAQANAEGGVLNSFVAEGWSSPDVALAANFWGRVGPQVADRLGLKNAQPHLVVNGRVVGPLTPKGFSLDDYAALESYELRKRVAPVESILKTYFSDMGDMPRDDFGDMVAVASSVVATAYLPQGAEGIWVQQQAGRSRMYEKLDDGEM